MSDVLDDKECDNWENYHFKGENSFLEFILWNNFLYCKLRYVNLWKTTFWSTNWNMGWKTIAAEKEYSKQLTKMTMKLDFSERQRQLMKNPKDK